MHTRAHSRSPASRTLLLGLAAFAGVGLVSACLYFARAGAPWAAWAPQKGGTRRTMYGLEEQNRLIEAIYQVCGVVGWHLLQLGPSSEL